MNISSVIVRVKEEDKESVINYFNENTFCEFHHYENGKIIVTIEGDDVSDEIKKLKQIENTTNIISSSLIYSFCEDELEAEREKLVNSKDFPDWLNSDKIEAKDIKYSGSIKGNF